MPGNLVMWGLSPENSLGACCGIPTITCSGNTSSISNCLDPTQLCVSGSQMFALWVPKFLLKSPDFQPPKVTGSWGLKNSALAGWRCYNWKSSRAVLVGLSSAQDHWDILKCPLRIRRSDVGPRPCISNKPLCGTGATGLWTTLQVARTRVRWLGKLQKCPRFFFWRSLEITFSLEWNMW